MQPGFKEIYSVFGVWWVRADSEPVFCFKLWHFFIHCLYHFSLWKPFTACMRTIIETGTIHCNVRKLTYGRPGYNLLIPGWHWLTLTIAQRSDRLDRSGRAGNSPTLLLVYGANLIATAFVSCPSLCKHRPKCGAEAHLVAACQGKELDDVSFSGT